MFSWDLFVTRIIQAYRVSQSPDHLQGKIGELPDITGITVYSPESRIIIPSLHEMLRQIMLTSAMRGEACIPGMSHIV